MGNIHSRNIHQGHMGLLVGMAALLAGEVRAQAADALFVAFRYQVNSTVQGCPSETDVRRKIGQQLGYDPFVSEASDQVTFQIDWHDEKDRPKEPELRGRVVWTDRAGNGKGERRFVSHDGDCAQLSRDMAFAAAVQIQLLATGASTAAPPTAKPAAAESSPHLASQPGESGEGDRASASAPARMAAPIATAAPAVPGPTSPAPRSWLVGVGPSVAWGLMPDAAAAGHLVAAAVSDHWAVAVGGEATVSTTTRDAYGAGFSARALLGTAAGCFRAGFVLACAVGKVGQMRVQGIGVDGPRQPSSLLAQAGPRLALLWTLGDHFFVLGQGDVLVAIDRPTVFVNHAKIWTAPRFAAMAGVDVGLRFP
jgi:hypothetical protein